MGTSHRPRHGQAVLGIPGAVPGIWRSLVNHSIALPGSCLLLHPIKVLERPGEAEGVESGLGCDPGRCDSSSRVKQHNKGAGILNECLGSWIRVSSVI